MDQIIYMKNLIANLKNIDPIKGFYILFSLAIFSRVVCDLLLNRIGIHNGEIFPERKIPFIPIYPVIGLYVEWTLAIAGIFFISQKKIRIGSFLILISYLMRLTQLYQNQKILMTIIALSLTILPLNKKSPSSIIFLRYQLCIIYFVSSLHKIISGFLSGETLWTVFDYLQNIEKNLFVKSLYLYFRNYPMCIAMSWISLIAELFVPLLLLKKPKWGIWVVVLMHTVFNLIMPDVMPFTLTMIALSLLFLLEWETSVSEK